MPAVLPGPLMHLHPTAFTDPGWRHYGADCDTDDHASDRTPDLEVDLCPDDEPPVLLGPDGQPLPRLVYRFGFTPAPELR